MAKPPPTKLDTVVSLCKRRGFVFPSGEIYGGTRSAWDYGPLGVELKENVKKQWWRFMVTQRDDMVGLDSSIILPTKTWEASGHLATFTDPLVECQSCHKRFREDHLQEEYAGKHDIGRPRHGRHQRVGALPQLRQPRHLDRAAAVQHDAEDLPRRRSRTSRGCTTCAPRPPRASSSTSPTS